MNEESMMKELFNMYNSSQRGSKSCFIKAAVDRVEFCMSIREAGLIWEAFDKAAYEWSPRIGGM